jgi:hypothetical protein
MVWTPPVNEIAVCVPIMAHSEAGWGVHTIAVIYRNPTLPQSVPVQDSCVRSGPRIEIVTTDGHRLTVEGDFDGDALARLLKGLVS